MSRSNRSGLPALAIPFAGLFVISGACGLTYQVVWSRLLVNVFGVTAFAVSTVLVSFMGGMALGAAVLGSRADRVRRPLRMFAILECSIGVYALLLPLLLHGVDWVYTLAYPMLPETVLVRSLFRFVMCLALLLVPTVLMGATLPALGRGLLQRRGRIGLGVGLLYFVNTLGASIGCYLAGFMLIPTIGLRGTVGLAVIFNFLVAATAWWLDRGEKGEPEPEQEAPSESVVKREDAVHTSPASWPLLVAFGSGMAALAFEIVWFRILVLSFGSTVYSFSAMLSVFLLGIALGSIVLGPVADRAAKPIRVLALIQLAVAVFTLAGYLAVNEMPELFLKTIAWIGIDFAGMNRTKMLLSFITLLPPALAFGGTFPVVVRLYSGRETGTGARIGRVYAWNTAGAILGSFGAGFILLPLIGSEWVLLAVVTVSLVLALGSILAEPGPLRPGWALPTGGLVLLVALGAVTAEPWDRSRLGAGAYFDPTIFISDDGKISMERVLADYSLTSYTEGYNDTIISYRSPRGKFITVNGSATASDQFEDMFSQRMLGHLPVALHPGKVDKALIVGLGAGVTAGAIAIYEIEELVAVELEEGVFAASRFFAEENHGVLDNPAVTIRIDDGRNYLKMTEERFDVISSAPNFPSLSGSGALYSLEYFRLAKSRLAPGGIMCQFVPIWRLYPAEVKTIIASFREVFPRIRVFSTGLSLVMLGRDEPFPPVDMEELTRRVSRPAVRESLLGIGVRGPVELLSFYQYDEPEIDRFIDGAKLNTDNNPRIEFLAPTSLFANTVGMNRRELTEIRPDVEERWARLGADDMYRESYIALASAYDMVVGAGVLMSIGQVNDAIEALKPVADSGHAYACHMIADRAEKTGLEMQRRDELPEARDSFLLALQYNPDRLPAMLGLGYIDLFLGNIPEAEAVLTRARERYPRSGGAASRLGLLREMQGRIEEAEVLYRQAISLQPMLAEPHALLGHALMARQDWASALEQLDIAIRLGAKSPGVLQGRDEAVSQMARDDEE